VVGVLFGVHAGGVIFFVGHNYGSQGGAAVVIGDRIGDPAAGDIVDVAPSFASLGDAADDVVAFGGGPCTFLLCSDHPITTQKVL
jgi:hypothetical protein